MSASEEGEVEVWAIDGNMGTGKSTLCAELQRRGYVVVEEDVATWTPILSKFYDEPSRWSFCLQTQILHSMASARKEVPRTDPVVFFERSPLSSLLFVEQAVEDGNLDADEKAVFMALHESLAWTPARALFLDVDVDECVRRVRTRGRAAEADVDDAYIGRLDKRYRDAVARGRLGDATARLDGTRPVAALADEVEAMLMQSS